MKIPHEKIQELSKKIRELIETSPVSELDHSLSALFQGMLTKMELVTREEFDVQAALLARTQQQLQQLEQKITALEHASESPKP